jgi:hypothetical protein
MPLRKDDAVCAKSLVNKHLAVLTCMAAFEVTTPDRCDALHGGGVMRLAMCFGPGRKRTFLAKAPRSQGKKY